MFNTTQRLSWLSSLTTAAFLGFMTLLSGCGGGGASSTTSVVADALLVSPDTAVAYSGTPVTLYISGGTKAYSVTSSNSAVIEVPFNVADSTVVFDAKNVGEDTPVILTVLDAKGKTATSTITVKPSVISNTVTITPDPSSPGTGCGTAVCSGMMASVTVQLKNFLGTPLANRDVRFDVMQGDYLFITNVSATTFADSITATTDQNGYAHVRIKANVNAPTQYATLKVTDLLGGSTLQSSFTIAQYTDGTGTLSVVPDTQTITAYYNTECSSGMKVDYIIHGGTPPYTVTSTSTGVATVFPSTVLTNGAGFTATTVGQICGSVIFDIKDANSRVITATLKNELGTHTVAVPPTPAAVALFTTAPATLTIAPISPAAGSSLSFVVGGGTAPYYASSSNPAFVTASITGGTSLTITRIAAGPASPATTVTVTDSAGATKSIAVN